MTSDRDGQAFQLGLFGRTAGPSRFLLLPLLQLLASPLLLLVVALRRGILQKAPMERAWWTATLLLVATHATDLPLFDSPLNILGWTLLAGLAAFNQELEWPPSPRPGRDGSAASPEPGAL